jgi:PAS domain S-box-containing protein
VGIFLSDVEGKCLFVNDRWCNIAGISQQAATSREWWCALYSEDRDRVLKEWRDATKDEREFIMDFRFKTPQGIVTWVLCNSITLHDDAGELTGHLGTLTDITELKEAEVALRITTIVDQHRKTTERMLLAVMSEIYDPLTAITGNVALLKDEELSSPIRACVREIEASAQKIDSLLRKLIRLDLLPSTVASARRLREKKSKPAKAARKK